VLGVENGARRLSLAQDTLHRAARVVQGEDGAEIGAAILLYLAQIGFATVGTGQHVRWPPIHDGAIEQDRRRWRRPYISALTWHDLARRILPMAIADALRDDTDLMEAPQGQRYNAALQRFPVLPGTDDSALHDLIRWHTEAFAYPGGAGESPARQELTTLARQWAVAPRSHRLADAVMDWIGYRVLNGDAAGLGTLLGLVRQGHLFTHAAIREHQHRALNEIHSLGRGWGRVLENASGLHALLYEPIPLFGSETWQFTARPHGGLRITLPEIVGLGRDAPGFGRRAWLDPLWVACARQDEAAQRRHLDRLRQLLALLGSNPEVLLMRETQPTEDAWDYLDEGIAFVESDVFDKGPVAVPSDDGLARGDPRRHRPDEETERSALFAIAQDVLRDEPGLWDAFYLHKIMHLPLREVATKLGLKSASAAKDRTDAARDLLQQDPRLREWFSS
jgi:hypothetical protein